VSAHHLTPVFMPPWLYAVLLIAAFVTGVVLAGRSRR
jgi:hypothetical protein